MNKKRVGILGGGQLSMMLAEAAIHLGLEPVVFCTSYDEPAAKVITNKIVAPPTDKQALNQFRHSVSIIAIESEFFPFSEDLAQKDNGAPVIPSLNVINILSNKLKQKQLWATSSLPTAEFVPFDPLQPVTTWLEQLNLKFPMGFVIKTALNGYDGKGVLICERSSESALRFCENAITNGSGLYAEQRILFTQEFAVIGCRSLNGDYISYPLVKSEQKNGICYLVTGPAVKLGISLELEKHAQAIAKQIAEITGLYGSFGVEFFCDQNGELLINEIAPRVHNSGHYTQDACDVSQFENHWKCLLGLALKEVNLKGVFAMQNLIGPEGAAMKEFEDNLNKSQTSSGRFLHWYSKNEIRPGRKLGHINVVVDNPTQLSEHLQKFSQRPR